MNRYKKLASNTVVLALGQFGSKLLVVLLMRFYQNMLGEEGYGEISTIIDTATLLMAFATLSIGESIIRFGLDRAYNNSQVFSIGVKVTLIGTSIGFLIVPALDLTAGLMPDNKVLALLNQYSWITAVYVFTGGMKSTCALFVRSNGNVRLYAMDGIFTTVMNILFNLLFLLAFKWGNMGYLLSVICADVCSILFLTYMGRLKKYFALIGTDRSVRKAMISFALPMIPTTVMWWIINAFRFGNVGFCQEWYVQSGLSSAQHDSPSFGNIFTGVEYVRHKRKKFPHHCKILFRRFQRLSVNCICGGIWYAVGYPSFYLGFLRQAVSYGLYLYAVSCFGGGI